VHLLAVKEPEFNILKMLVSKEKLLLVVF